MVHELGGDQLVGQIWTSLVECVGDTIDHSFALCGRDTGCLLNRYLRRYQIGGAPAQHRNRAVGTTLRATTCNGLVPPPSILTRTIFLELLPISPQFLDLIRVVELAEQYGLARDDSNSGPGLVTQPRYRLPSGRWLTQNAYSELVNMAVHPWNIIKRGGSGSASTWKMEPDRALEMLRAVVEETRKPGRPPAGPSAKG